MVQKFSSDVKVTDEELKAAGGNDVHLKSIWAKGLNRLRDEFVNFDTFAAFAKSLADGRSAVCTPGKVVRSGIGESKTFLAN